MDSIRNSVQESTALPIRIILLRIKKQNLAEAEMTVTEIVAGLSLLGLGKYSGYEFKYES